MGRFDAHEGECTKNPTPLFSHRFGRGRFGRGGVLGRFWGVFFSSKTAVIAVPSSGENFCFCGSEVATMLDI
jgi:hypothetical protein